MSVPLTSRLSARRVGRYDGAVKVGIRAEDKSIWEKRIPLVPDHIAALREKGCDIVVEPSTQRAFGAEEFTAANIPLAEDLGDCDVVMGVKEIPSARFQAGKTYVFFSHTIKGQPYNMAMLKRLMALGCQLIDYECIVDDADRRLVFFGTHAGLAGMIDSLWALGQRFALDGHTTPLADLKQALAYPSLADAKAAIAAAGRACRAEGALAGVGPVVLGVTGNGRVSQGAQEISALLEPIPLTPAELLAGGAKDPGEIYQVVFEEEDMAAPKDGGEMDRATYYAHPDRFEGTFPRFLPHLSALVNCIYWEERYPRLVSKADLHALWADGTPKLKVIGDISCDIEGSVEATVKPASPGEPVFVYDLDRDAAVDGIEGRGPVIMAVEILPTEIPRDASLAFSEALVDLMPALAKEAPPEAFEDWALPAPLKRAVILHRGELTERYRYMQDFLTD